MAGLTHLVTHRKTIRDQVALYPMVAFITLAYAFSFFWLLSFQIDLGWVNGFGILGSISPALAAMIVSALLKPEQSGIPASKRWQLFGRLGILFLAVMAVLRFWNAAGLVSVSGIPATEIAYPTLTAFLMDVVAATAVAFILSGVHSPRQGVRDLLQSLNPRQNRVRWTWWAIAVGLWPVVFILGNAISTAVGLPVPAITTAGEWYWLALDVFLTFLFFLFGGGGLEEPGWRGFALPLLLKRYSPLLSSLILGVIWAFWHWPYAVSGGSPWLMIFFLQQCVPLAILFTAVYSRTRGSLLIAILLHASINTTTFYLPESIVATILWMLLCLGLAFWMWRFPHAFFTGHQVLPSNIQSSSS